MKAVLKAALRLFKLLFKGCFKGFIVKKACFASLKGFVEDCLKASF